MKKIVIFGTGEISELATYYMKNDSDYEIVAYTADTDFIKSESFLGKPLVPFENITKIYPPEEYGMHVALSYNKLNQIRKTKYIEAKEKGYKLVSYVCSKSVFWKDISVGENCLILENQTIQPTVKIHDNVMIWSGNHLGHGCEIKSHSYLSSHICISGHTIIGEQCFIGVNSSFKDFITIGNRVFITMGVSVTSNIPDDSVVLGPQSKILDSENELGIKIKRRFFNL